MKNIRVSGISYLNTKPFLFGLRHFGPEGMILTEDIPSECARKLKNGEADIGLVPVATIPGIPGVRIISDFCIGADGSVDSVKLYSDVPLQQIERILLDYQSRTSVNLTRILCREFWNINPEFVAAEQGFERQISSNTAAVVIGDRTFTLNGTFAYEFDLSEEWKKFTGQPFVFACWVAHANVPDAFISGFSDALQAGIENIDAVVEENKNLYGQYDVKKYLKHFIQYHLDSPKKEALQLFLSKLKENAAL